MRGEKIGKKIEPWPVVVASNFVIPPALAYKPSCALASRLSRSVNAVKGDDRTSNCHAFSDNQRRNIQPFARPTLRDALSITPSPSTVISQDARILDIAK
jgi:hypothetical protein